MRTRGRAAGRRQGRQQRRRRYDPRNPYRNVEGAAKSRLRFLRSTNALLVALTGFLLVLWGMPTTGQEPEEPAAEVAVEPDTPLTETAVADAEVSLTEATETVRDLLHGFYALLPKILVAFLLIVLAWLVAAVVRAVLHRTLRGWERVEAISALVRIGLFLLAIGAGLSVIAGDARALVGSVGLVGLALSWALQTPIESFTGWMLNAFRAYYRPGDRIEVGDVFGDVYRIDILTTTVWEAGGPGKPIAAAQPTGALVTFPNWEILRSNIINYSRDLPFIWDEVTVGLANESDLAYSVNVIQEIAQRVVGEMMKEPAQKYRELLRRRELDFDVDDRPQVYVSMTDAWTNCTVRYMVPVRQRRTWSTKLLLILSQDLARPEHRGRIIPSYPRTQVELLDRKPPVEDDRVRE